MSTFTPNYNLEKPASGDDFKNFTTSYGNNMDIIDANLGGGGGGNVDDVLVNGVSVVDGNHDAQITSYKEVTQAQYDALPATKLTDGIAYFIKDAGGGGGSSSHNYSTTEQVIGTWINSKPVYEKTFVFTPTALTTLIDVSGLQIEDLIERKGTFTRNAGGTIQQKAIEYRTESSAYNNYGIQCELRDTNLYVSITGYTYTEITQFRITLQYTKTN